MASLILTWRDKSLSLSVAAGSLSVVGPLLLRPVLLAAQKRLPPHPTVLPQRSHRKTGQTSWSGFRTRLSSLCWTVATCRRHRDLSIRIQRSSMHGLPQFIACFPQPRHPFSSRKIRNAALMQWIFKVQIHFSFTARTHPLKSQRGDQVVYWPLQRRLKEGKTRT